MSEKQTCFGSKKTNSNKRAPYLTRFGLETEFHTLSKYFKIRIKSRVLTKVSC